MLCLIETIYYKEIDDVLKAMGWDCSTKKVEGSTTRETIKYVGEGSFEKGESTEYWDYNDYIYEKNIFDIDQEIESITQVKKLFDVTNSLNTGKWSLKHDRNSFLSWLFVFSILLVGGLLTMFLLNFTAGIVLLAITGISIIVCIMKFIEYYRSRCYYILSSKNYRDVIYKAEFITALKVLNITEQEINSFPGYDINGYITILNGIKLSIEGKENKYVWYDEYHFKNEKLMNDSEKDGGTNDYDEEKIAEFEQKRYFSLNYQDEIVKIFNRESE